MIDYYDTGWFCAIIDARVNRRLKGRHRTQS